MGLRRVPFEMLADTPHGRRHRRHGRRRGGGLAVAVEPSLLLHFLQERVVREIAPRRDDAVPGEVGARVQAPQVGRRQRADGFLRAEDLEAIRMARPHRLVGEIEDFVVRGVLDRADLFQHDLPLEREVGVAQDGAADYVGDDIERARQVGIQHARVVGGGVARRVGIERAAARLQRHRDLLRRAPLGALEYHVLEQVRNAHLGTRLVRAGGAHPDADRHGSDAWLALAQHRDAIGRGGAMDFAIQPHRI